MPFVDPPASDAFVAAWLLLRACAIAVTGCAGAPVQEMSNARQAVRAAEKAGAVTLAPALMAEARQALRAESHLRQGESHRARRSRTGACQGRRGPSRGGIRRQTASP